MVYGGDNDYVKLNAISDDGQGTGSTGSSCGPRSAAW